MIHVIYITRKKNPASNKAQDYISQKVTTASYQILRIRVVSPSRHIPEQAQYPLYQLTIPIQFPLEFTS